MRLEKSCSTPLENHDNYGSNAKHSSLDWSIAEKAFSNMLHRWNWSEVEALNINDNIVEGNQVVQHLMSRGVPFRQIDGVNPYYDSVSHSTGQYLLYLPDHSYNLITAYHAFNHMSKHELDVNAQRIASLLKESGQLFMIEKEPVDDLTRALGDAGLTEARLQEIIDYSDDTAQPTGWTAGVFLNPPHRD